ncbi:MAG: hypothetical protein QM487_03960 [Candidatus Marithrix sp.]
MQLDRIQAIVRPRNPWEAIDLGFRMVQSWWRPLYKIWFIFVLPICLIIYWSFYYSWWLPALIIWWLKPWFDRIILYFLSHALFDEQVTVRQVWKILPKLFKTNLFIALTLGRFDLARTFNLPVWQLENLTGKVAIQRINLLQKKVFNSTIHLLVICLLFYLVLYLSMFGLIYLIIPLNANFELINLVNIWWIKFFSMFFNLIALSIIEPLYVAAGFALYLNRRTHLEAWDIELSFRSIASIKSE